MQHPINARFIQIKGRHKLENRIVEICKEITTHQFQPRHDKTNGLCTQQRVFAVCFKWEAKDPSILHADSEDSDQTERIPWLIWVFAGRTGHFVSFVILRLKFINYITSEIKR